MTVHVVTGATGFVGGALVLELLRDPGAVVYAVVRGHDDEHADRRGRSYLSTAANAYDDHAVWDASADRFQILRGDVTAPMCGLGHVTPDHADHVWHSAAVLHYEQNRAARIAEVNHLGTRNVIALARRLGAELNHVSTAYIAPSRNGTQVEEPARDAGPPESVTPYHEAKARAEGDVVECGLPWRILRPPFVVGHSSTHAATHFAGLYAMARRLRNAARVHGTVQTVLDVPGNAELNLIPVDVLARAAVSVGTRGPAETVYHLVNAAAPRSRTVLESLFTWCGLPAPRYETDTAKTTGGPAATLALYLPYMRTGMFDRVNAERIVGPHALAAPLGTDDLLRFLDAYLTTLVARTN